MSRALAVGLIALLLVQNAQNIAWAAERSEPGARTTLAAPNQDRQQPPPEIAEFVRGLAPGTQVKLRLTDGTRVSGLLMTVGGESVSVRPRTRIPEPLRRVAIQDIADADLIQPRSMGKTIATAAAVGAGSALAVLFALIAAYGGD